MQNTVKLTVLFILLYAGCVEEGQQMDSTLEMHRGKAIYGDNQDMNRLDRLQQNISQTTDEHRASILWEELSKARSAVAISSRCGSEKDERGSGTLIGKNRVVTADHVVRSINVNMSEPGGVPCSPIKELPSGPRISLSFSRDRQGDDFQELDFRPPNSWLLKNRFYIMSLFESGSFDSNMSYKDILNIERSRNTPGSLLKSYAGNSDPSMNVDLAIIEIKSNAFFPITVHGKSASIPPGVFFDFANLPQDKDHLTPSDKQKQIFGVHNNVEPVSKTRQNGDWQVDFRVDNSEPSDVTPPAYSTPIFMGRGKLYEEESFLNEQCHPAEFYGKYCFSHTIDNIGGSSGGGIYFKRDTRRARLIGVINGGPDDPSWESNTGLYRDPPMNLDDLSTGTLISPVIVEDFPPYEPPASDGTKYVPGVETSGCVGSGCTENSTNKMILFSCAEALTEHDKNASNSINFDINDHKSINWVPGPMVGFVGSPMMADNQPGDEGKITGIGSLGVVCQRWTAQNTLRGYHEQWEGLKVVGLFRNGDSLAMPITPGKVSSLNRVLTTMPLILTNPNNDSNGNPPNGEVPRYHKPIPAKFCAPGHVMTGFSMYAAKDKSFYRGLRSIRCVAADDVLKERGEGGVVREYFLDTNKVRPRAQDANEFVQYIGNPKEPTGADAEVFEEVKFDCGAKKVLTGVEMNVLVGRRRGQNALRRLTGVNIDCQEFNP